MATSALGTTVPAKPFLAALAGRRPERPPVWLMRQAGRYLPEYRALRARQPDFLAFCYDPDLATEATLQPIRRFGFDAAILFADIMVTADALGCPVRFDPGPKMEPVRDADAVARLDPGRLHERLAPIYETVRRVRAALPDDVALIGFAGAPWTVAAYMVEGGASRSKEFEEVRLFARREPQAFQGLIDRLTEATSDYLIAQIDAGAEAVQLFDSWAGVLPEPEFDRWCVAPARRIAERIGGARPGTPIIAFPRGCGALYEKYAGAVPLAGLSLDTTVSPAWAARNLPSSLCLQGNLDPVALLRGGPVLVSEARRIVEALADRPHVFNLGHGVLPATDPDNVPVLLEAVHGA